jgi:hypothetical protein
LSKVWNGGDGWNLSGDVVCHARTYYAPSMVVDTPGQHVSSRVRYGMTCLLIRDAVGSVPCSNEWEIGVVTRLGSHGAKGAVVLRLPQETLALLWYSDYLS